MQTQQNLIFRLPLRYLIVLSLLGYLLLFIFFPLLPHYDRQPVADILAFAPSLMGGLLYALLILYLFGLLALQYRSIKNSRGLTPQVVSAVTCLLAIPLLFMYPINANDVYRYVMRGLISSRYGANPYEQPPIAFGEALNPALAGEWAGATSPYGPIWEITASILTSFGQDNLLFNLVLFKILGLLALVGAGVVIWKLLSLHSAEGAKSRNHQIAFLVIWAWNPALLLSFVGNAHNDALMILVLLLGWLLITLGHDGPGMVLIFAAALIKPIALLALPVLFIYSWRRSKRGRAQVTLVLWTLLGGILLTILSFMPFGSPQSLVLRLLGETGGGASFSPTTLIILLTRELGLSISFNVILSITTILFGLFFLYLLWRTWRDKAPEQNVALAFWAYCLQAMNFRIWYAVWPFPWLLLDAYSGRDRAVYGLHAGLWFLLTSQLSVVLYGHIRASILDGSHLLAHLIGIPLVFLLPFVLAKFTAPQSATGESER